MSDTKKMLLWVAAGALIGWPVVYGLGIALAAWAALLGGR